MAKIKTLNVVRLVYGELNYPDIIDENTAINQYHNFEREISWADDQVLFGESFSKLNRETYEIKKVLTEHSEMKGMLQDLVGITAGHLNRFETQIDKHEFDKDDSTVTNVLEYLNGTVKTEKDNRQAIEDYIVEMLDYLEGRGIIFTDEDLVRKTLKADFGNFSNLKKLM